MAGDACAARPAPPGLGRRSGNPGTVQGQRECSTGVYGGTHLHGEGIWERPGRGVEGGSGRAGCAGYGVGALGRVRKGHSSTPMAGMAALFILEASEVNTMSSVVPVQWQRSAASHGHKDASHAVIKVI